MTLSKESSKEALQITDFAVNIEETHHELIKNCAFIKHSKPDVIIDSSIMVLSLLSYVHSKQTYSNIFNWIERVFNHFVEEIVNNESILVRARYALFLGYLIDVLYKNDPAAF